MNNKEEWREIDGFPGYYISNIGRVKSYRLHNVGQIHGCDKVGEKSRIMSTKSDDGNGYLKVMLRRNGKSYCRKIHKLVAQAFIPNPDGYETVDHINSNKKDNRVENLQWISRHDNVSKAYKDGLHAHDISMRRIPYMAIDAFTLLEYYFNDREELADFLEIDPTTISHELKGQRMARIRDYDVYKLRNRSDNG